MIDRLSAALEGRYRIERELGQGGMATVYLAQDLKHNRKVALKVLKPELAAVVGAERFLKEIEVTAGLQHPHILPLFDSGEADGFLYYVMPYVEGESLRERLDREKQLPVEEAVAIGRKVAGALQAAHERGVVHRDIKPANVLLGERGEPLVADFGIALAVQEAGGGRLTETGLSLGTPYYMSPEQATGDRDVTARSDVYALGCVLYEMLVGEPPYVGNTAQAVLGKILTDTPRSPTAVRAAVPRHVEGAVLKALEKLPADRFASAEDFAAALVDPTFRYPREGTGAGAWSSSGGLWKPVAFGALALAVLLAAVLARDLMRPAPPPDPVRFQISSTEEMSILGGPGITLDVSPDGSAVAFVAQAAGGSRLWLRRMGQLRAEPIRGTEDGRNPRFSPDGRSLAFTSDGRLLTVALGGGPPLTLISDSVPDGAAGVTWGPDGHLYVTRLDGRIWRVSEGGGSPERLGDDGGEEGGMHWLDALPSGKGILFTRDLGIPPDDRIEVLSLETGETTPLFPGTTARYVSTGHIVYTDAQGTLLAVLFDQERLEVTGTARTILEGVQVNTGSASQFALSDAGVLTYLPGTQSAGGVPTWVGEDGQEEPLPGLPPGGQFFFPAVSPDGRRVALMHGSGGTSNDIWILDLEGGVFTRFTFEGDNWAPFWSPDGREVGFVSNRQEENRAAIYTRPADMSLEPRLLRASSEAQDDMFRSFWTPGGERLVYVTEDGTIRHVPPHPDSSEVEFLRGGVQSASLSPDGRWIAYGSTQSGESQVYVRPFPGPGGQYQVSTEPSVGPLWTPDGRDLVYQRDDDDVWVRARLDVESGFRVVERSPFFDGNGAYFDGWATYDLAPDGRLLAIRAAQTSGEGALVVVRNWFTELGERMGERR